MNPAALADAASCISTALNAGQDRLVGIAEQAYLEASFASGDAFPLDSKESEALGVILAAVARFTETQRSKG